MLGNHHFNGITPPIGELFLSGFHLPLKFSWDDPEKIGSPLNLDSFDTNYYWVKYDTQYDEHPVFFIG